MFLTFFLIGSLLESLAKYKTVSANNPVSIENLYIVLSIRIPVRHSPPLDSIMIESETEFEMSTLTGESALIRSSR